MITNLKLPTLKLASLLAIMTLATTLTTACSNTNDTEKTTEVSMPESTETKNSDSDEPFAHIKEGEAVENPENFTIDGKPASMLNLGEKSSSEDISDNSKNDSEGSTADEVAMEALMMADEIEGTEEDLVEATE